MNATPTAPRKSRSWYARSAALFRWVHIYLSMLSFTALMFFAITGLTLNHPTWLGAASPVVRDEDGTLPTQLVAGDVDKLAVAETLRREHRLRGSVSEFEISELECMVVFKSPGYAADVFIDRATGSYTMTTTTSNIVAVMNDLHKGRDSGPQWSWAIDVSAVMMIIVSLSGFGLLFYLRTRRQNGVIVAVIGTIVLVLVWWLWVP